MAAPKNTINYNEFLRQFQKGAVKPLYVFQGQETFLIDEALDFVKQTLIQADSADFNVDKFSAKDLHVGEVLDQAQTMPFLSKWRLIVINDVGDLNAAAQKQMLPYLENPNISTCLIMTTEKLDSRTKFAQTIAKHGEVVQFWKLFERDLPQWICARAKKYGYGMTPQTAKFLAEFVGNELRQLDNELKKIIAYTNQKEITNAVVQQVVGDVRERDIFELVDAVSAGNILEALRILNQLLIEGEQPLKILALVTRQFRLLWKTKAWLVEERSLPAKQLASKVGVMPRVAEGLLRQVQRFSQIQLKYSLKRLSQVDLALKSSGNSPQILLEELFIDLCS